MFRFIRWVLFTCFILFITSLLLIWFALTPLLESLFSKKLHSDVKIESVHVGWKKLRINEMRIKNSSSSALPYAFETSSILIQMNPLELFKEKVHIERIKIENPYMSLELFTSDGKQNNWVPLLKEEEKSSGTSCCPRRVIIDRLSIVNLQVELIPGKGKKPILLPEIPYLEFNGLGRMEPLSLGEVSKQIIVKILETLRSKQNLSSLLDQITTTSSDTIDQLGTSTLENVKSTVKEGVEAMKRKAEEAQEYLQNLFSK